MAPAADRGDTIDHGRTDCVKPSLEPLPALREEKLSEYTEANLPYTATITLFGDCTASRQYLSIAAKLNPITLMKILARLNPKYDRFKVDWDSVC